MASPYWKLEQERDLTLSYSGYNSEPYRANKLWGYYTSGFFHGIDERPDEIRLKTFTPEQRKAYVHGFFTGLEVARKSDDDWGLNEKPRLAEVFCYSFNFLKSHKF